MTTDLVHQHLPMLEDQGYVEWDLETNSISRGPNWDQIGPLVRLMHRHREELLDGWLWLSPCLLSTRPSRALSTTRSDSAN
jgi:hypothetical protein